MMKTSHLMYPRGTCWSEAYLIQTLFAATIRTKFISLATMILLSTSGGWSEVEEQQC